ncbi:MAG TPA: hypothetical protein VD791_13680, partial [Burkholderiales bacterium]|nr:hypothetical protein [Burkholderiales bacterium]
MHLAARVPGEPDAAVPCILRERRARRLHRGGDALLLGDLCRVAAGVRTGMRQEHDNQRTGQADFHLHIPRLETGGTP